ncbi:MAG: DNA polymerase III subunit delta [Calditrichia bacterium]
MTADQPRKLYYQQAIKEVEDGIIKTAYLLFGEEHLLAENLINKIKETFLEKVEPELNYFIRYAGEEGADKVISLGAGSGLFSQKKLILLREAHSLKQNEVERLIKFMEKMPPEICLIFHTSNSSLYQTRLNQLEHLMTSVNLLPLRTNDLNQFVRDEFRKAGKEISNDALELLLFCVGSQLTDLTLQINNIVQYFSDKNKIDSPEVEQVAAVYVTQDIFEYNRQLVSGNFEKSILILSNLLDSGVSPQYIVSQLFRHFTILWRIKGFHRSGTRNPEKISQELKIFSKYYREYEVQSNDWKFTGILSVLNLLSQTDVDLKNSTTDAKIILDMLSRQILNSK